jgi:TusA-related sulfurtransferase
MKRETVKTKIDHYLDITSDICPITFVKAKLLMEKMAAGEVAEVRLSEGEPLENVPRSVVDEGHQVLSLQADDQQPGIHVLVLQKT